MSDRDSPVTPDELHAYVDGEIPADRRGAVEAWLANHPEDAARVAAWQAQAEPVPARLNLDKLARGARPWRGIAAAAAGVAFFAGITAGWMAHGVSAKAP